MVQKFLEHIKKRDGSIAAFDKNRVTEAIFSAAKAVGGTDRKIAEDIAEKVVHSLKMKFGTRIPSVEDVQDAVEKQLIESGHAKTAKTFILYRTKRAELRESSAFLKRISGLVDNYVSLSDWRVMENSNAGYSLSGMQAHISGAVIAEYTLRNIYPEEISNAHRNGDFHIHDLGNGVFSGYSFYRNETIIVREKASKQLFSLALEQFFDLVNSSVVEENGFEIKYCNDFEVLDEQGWTNIKRVLRHKTDKQLISFNSARGSNLIVTEDHPFITIEQEKEFFSCPHCQSTKIFKNRTNKKGVDYFKCKVCEKNFKKPVEKIGKTGRKEIFAGDVKLSNYAITPGFELSSGAKNNLSPEAGWFIGFFVAEGYFKDKHYAMFEVSPNSPETHKLLNYLSMANISHNLFLRDRDNNTTTKVQSPGLLTQQAVSGMLGIRIDLRDISEEMQELFLQIRPGSENKNFPISFLNYSEEFVGGMISGLIDGDGTVRNDDPWVSRAVIRLTSKTILSQSQFWLSSQKINSSLSTIDSFGERVYKNNIIKPGKQLYSLSIYIPETKAHLFSQCVKMGKGFKFSSKEPSFEKTSHFRKIEQIRNDSEFVYDITTESHTFICNSILAHNCAGWSLAQVLELGFNGVPGRIEAKPAKHFNAALGQIVNFMGTLQNEWAGAQAFNSFDTYMAPLAAKDNLSYKQIKQSLQEFVFATNATSRWGNQVPFTNITLDWTVPEDIKDNPVIYGGEYLENETYGNYQETVDMINKAFLEIMIKGDMNGRVFTFPIPTYNITKDFNWDSEAAELLFEMTSKYGIPYFQNFVNSSLKPTDVRAMCLEKSELLIVKTGKGIERLEIGQVSEKFSQSYVGEWAEPKEDVFVLSLNPESYGIEWAKINAFYKTSDTARVKIKTKDGKEIVVSKDHPVAVYSEQGIQTKPAQSIMPRDILLTTKNASTCLNAENQFFGNLELDEGLAFFLGLFIAEGNYLYENRKNMANYGKPKGMQFSFNTKEQHLVFWVKEFAKNRFGKEIKTKKDPRYQTICCYIYDTGLVRALSEGGIRKKGLLAQAWFNSPKKVILSFLNGIFSGDGYAKGKEIHINDFLLAKDIALLYTACGIPVTFRQKQNSQVIRIQHTSGRGSRENTMKNDLLANRIPQFVVSTGKTKPFYNKQFLVSLSAIEKHSAHTQESLKLSQSSMATIQVESVSIEYCDEPIEFFDIELEKNHFFIHSLGAITHNCCRLQLNLKELRSKTGGLFGSGDKTGSIGVVTINLPKIGYLAKEETDFFERLEQLMYLGKESLEIKRKEVSRNMENGLLPWSKRYLGSLNNHFSTIGLIGMNEACLNFLGEEISTKEGKAFAMKTLNFMRERLQEFQEETSHIYNLEATPAESTSYRLARIDKKFYPEIKSMGTKQSYYTNSTQLPVNFTDDIFEALQHQDDLQTRYTGGTVFHGFLGEAVSDTEACRKLVRKIAYSYKMPYYTITPTFSVCPVHGYLKGAHFSCPIELNGKKIVSEHQASREFVKPVEIKEN